MVPHEFFFPSYPTPSADCRVLPIRRLAPVVVVPPCVYGWGLAAWGLGALPARPPSAAGLNRQPPRPALPGESARTRAEPRPRLHRPYVRVQSRRRRPREPSRSPASARSGLLQASRAVARPLLFQAPPPTGWWFRRCRLYMALSISSREEGTSERGSLKVMGVTYSSHVRSYF